MAAIVRAQQKYEAKPSEWTPDKGYYAGTLVSGASGTTGGYAMPATTSYTMANLGLGK